MDRKKIGRYEILGELGRGAMGAVLRARDPAMGREVALKCILSTALAGDPIREFRERFYREARAAGALAHPGIVPVFDVGEDDGVPFLVMELVQGRTLDSAIKHGEQYSLERICEIGQQIADALGYAHRKGVIHRDIKPANILMTAREIYGAERPRITDFGVAKLAFGEATTTGQLLGTPAFMPPEQFTGGAIDGRTDLFALGVILYRMTTGEHPFPGESLPAVSYKVVHTEPVAPSDLNPAIPRQLEAVILRCLAKNAVERYQTGEELAADLQAVKPGPRVSGRYSTIAKAVAAQGGAGKTIDPVASLRPAAALTFPVAPTVISGSRSRPVIPTAHAPAPPVPFPPAPPAQPFGVTTTAWPVREAAPPAPRPAPTPATPLRPIPVPARSFPAPPSAAAPASPSRTHPPAPHPSATLRPVGPAGVEFTMSSTRSRRGTAAKPSSEPTPARKRGGMGIFAWLILIAVGVGGSWLFLQMHVQQGPPGSETGQPVSAGAVAAGAVGFNPKTLDPAASAHLAFDLDALPSALSVTVLMDGKTYWSGIAGDHDSYDGLRAPPGRHTLRVIVSGGGRQKSSGNLSGDFVAKKKMTLTVKLWPQSNGTFDPSSDVVMSLEKSLFSL